MMNCGGLRVEDRGYRVQGLPGVSPHPPSTLRDMCQEISTTWGSQTLQDFDQLCEYNPVEAELTECLADVREPCQLGCRGLTYCSNFNNRWPPDPRPLTSLTHNL